MVLLGPCSSPATGMRPSSWEHLVWREILHFLSCVYYILNSAPSVSIPFSFSLIHGSTTLLSYAESLASPERQHATNTPLSLSLFLSLSLSLSLSLQLFTSNCCKYLILSLIYFSLTFYCSKAKRELAVKESLKLKHK